MCECVDVGEAGTVQGVKEKDGRRSFVEKHKKKDERREGMESKGKREI